MKKKDLLLEDFKNSDQEAKNVHSIIGGNPDYPKITKDGSNNAHTAGDIGNCDTDDEVDWPPLRKKEI